MNNRPGAATIPKGCWSYVTQAQQNVRYHYIWPFERHVDNKARYAYFSSYSVSQDMQYYGQSRPYSVCVTRMSIYKFHASPDNAYLNCHVQIFDQFGNPGYFTIGRGHGDYGMTPDIRDGFGTSGP